ncbi:helix-turn-helix domain-containing protein [Devosia sp.]|uniref:helix-turn-helix domain-containing protein n=1 Tax=Devosia sp. TaxID=1871048 RepID=UPI003BA9D5AB
MLISGFGQFIFWKDGSLYIGSAVSPSELHSHHAIQLSLGLQGKVQFKTTPASDWIEYDGAVIPPDLLHTFQAPGRVLAHIFTQPESQLGRRILSRFGSQEISRLSTEEAHRLAAPLKHAYFNDVPDADLIQIARQTCAQLVGAMEPEHIVDPRILRAFTEIDHRLDSSFSLGEIASRVGLSEGRFRHLFVTETGVAFRPYVLWARLNRALALGYSGVSWTEAAHAAYFADSAHLTRTCRRMFGIAPSSIKDAGRAVAGIKTA